MSILFALAAAVGWGSSDFAAGHATRRSSAVSVVILTHFASVVALLVVALEFSSSGVGVKGTPSVADISWGLGAGVAGGVGAMLLFRGLGRGSMAVVAPITATGAAAVPVLFGIVTGDSITHFGLVGIALALMAIVLVSVTGLDDGSDDGEVDDPLLVPEGWSTEFELPHPSGAFGGPPSTPGRLVSAGVVSHAGEPLAPPPVEMTHSEIPPPPGPRIDIHKGELRMPLRTVRQAVLALVTTAVLSAAAIASHPIGALLDGEDMSGTITSQIVFALVVVGLAAFALNNVKPLFDFSDLTMRRDGSDVDATTAGRTTTANAAMGNVATTGKASSLSWRAIVGQPGVSDALVSGIGFGLFFVFISRASELAGYWPLVGARAVSVAIFVLVALGGTTARIVPDRGTRLTVVLAGVLDAAAAVLFVLSTREGLLSVGAVLAALYPVVTVLLARLISKERIRPQQFVGLALGFVAVGLLAI
jgi:drug/metabolite transporter (DMT)-like permease